MSRRSKSAKLKSTARQPILSRRFIEALGYAARLHARQFRKRTSRPYIGHLLSVTAIVLEYGGDEDMAIAALLHDAVEDQGGMPRLREIGKKFGPRVARIVDGCTDAYTEPKPPWRTRKEAYIHRVAHEPADVRLVSAADKLSNARETLADFRLRGNRVFAKFGGKKVGTLWYYRALIAAFRSAVSQQEREPAPSGGFYRALGARALVDELGRVVTQLETLAEKSARK
jgi:(p)ppGpp synthase/HD superfamily hydrolase